MSLLYWEDQRLLSTLTTHLQKDAVALTSTDTILGLLAQTSEAAFYKLNELKGRQNKPYIVLVSGAHKVEHFVDQTNLSPAVSKILHRFWPGPLTIIFKARPGLPSFLVSPTNTIALRCPLHHHLTNVLTHFEGLFSTSANRHVEPIPLSLEAVCPAIKDQTSLTVIERAHSTIHHIPSTIIDVTHNGKIELYREGILPFQQITALLE
jgi:L-threonylcarbamoyladenylate synthase